MEKSKNLPLRLKLLVLLKNTVFRNRNFKFLIAVILIFVIYIRFNPSIQNVNIHQFRVENIYKKFSIQKPFHTKGNTQKPLTHNWNRKRLHSFVSFTGIENDTTYYVKWTNYSFAKENVIIDSRLTNRKETDFTSEELNETDFFDLCKLLNPLRRYRIVNFENVNVIAEKCDLLLLTKVSSSGVVNYEPPSLAQRASCCVKGTREFMTKGNKPKKRIEQICRQINESYTTGGVQLKPNEFPQVNCTWKDNPQASTKQTEYKTFFGPTPSSNAKVKFWKDFKKHSSKYFTKTIASPSNFPDKSPPISILFIGISTVSRNQANQTFLNTYQYMQKEMIFHEYRNYFQAGQGIPENFYPILTGKTLYECLNRNETTGVFLKSKDCNSIVEMYNTLKYVTLLGIQNELTPFKIQTDYNLQELLSIYDQGMETEADECFEYNMLFEIFSYTSKFLENFKDTPTFAALWLNSYPHLSESSLKLLDYLLMRFLKQVSVSTQENTVIIVLSEGGYYATKYMENTKPIDPHAYSYQYFENQYPMLKVYYPFKELSQSFVNYSLPNRYTLISFHDLYETLLVNIDATCSVINQVTLLQNYIVDDTPVDQNVFKFPKEMSLFCSNFKNENNNRTITPLWEWLYSIRTCKMAHLDPRKCMCNTRILRNPQYAFHPTVVENAINFIINNLNQYIENSYPAINSTQDIQCSMWTLGSSGIKAQTPILSTRTLPAYINSKNKNSTLTKEKDLLVTFNAQAAQWDKEIGLLNTYFQAIVRFNYKNHNVTVNDTNMIDSSDYTMELLQFPVRVLESNEAGWGKWSNCVKHKNDPKLSRICYCIKTNRRYSHIKLKKSI